MTASFTPTPEARELDGDEGTEDAWDEMLQRTPLPEDLTQDQRTSMYKQLWCHFQWNEFSEDGGGPTWDLEAEHPNIAWREVKSAAAARKHKCNWGDRDPYYNLPPTDPDGPPTDLPPMVDAGPDVAGEEGAAVVLDGSAWDDTGTPETAWTYQPLSGVDEGTTCEFTDPAGPRTEFTCTDDGRFTVTLTADDGVNAPVGDSAVVTLDNVAPELDLQDPQDWDVHRVEDEVRIVAPFTDPGTNDTHVCTITWDDGETSTFDATDNTCDIERPFTDAGMYTIEVEVADDDGGSDRAETMVMVYDPRAGVVSAVDGVDGVDAVSAVDDLTFTVAAKYPTVDSTAPLGAVVFDVSTDDGHRTIVSTDLEWLVITPDGKAAVKGNAIDHGFLGYVESGHFRGVIWDLADGPTPPAEPVYDTSPGSSWDIDEAEPKPVSIGVIVIDSGWVPGLPELPIPFPLLRLSTVLSGDLLDLGF